MNKIRSILKRASKIDMCYNTCLYIASSWGLDGDSLVFMRVSGGFLRDFLGRSFNMDDEFLVVYKYERFWRGSEPSIYAEIWCFSPYFHANGSQDGIPMSSYSTANESQDCIPMSPYSPANGSQDCIPWVPISLPMDLKNAFPWVPISLPMDLKTQTAFPWVPIPLPNFWRLLVGYHPRLAILLQTVP